MTTGATWWPVLLSKGECMNSTFDFISHLLIFAYPLIYLVN